MGCNSATESSTEIPRLVGTYSLSVTYTGVTVGGTQTGTMTFQQPDPAQTTLLITGSLRLNSIESTTDFRNGSVDAAGTVRFDIGSGWGFEGQLSPDARTISGSHTDTVHNLPFGTWSATKQ
jgi:hypothetical protein